MSRSIGAPMPDCESRRKASKQRRANALQAADRRGGGATMGNGEEIEYGLGFGMNYHKGLPHDLHGFVHCESYHAMVRMLTGNEAGAIETLPVGENRSGLGPAAEINPPRYTTTALDAPDAPLGYRKLTSPMTGHVYEMEGADSGAFAIGAAPSLASDELAAEMAEIYVMALLRDCSFTQIENGSCPANLASLVSALQGMSWFNGSYVPQTPAERRRFETRLTIAGPADLFRGSTPGAQAGPWLSQYLLIGNQTPAASFVKANGTPADPNPAGPDFRGTRSVFGREDGFVLFGAQIIDQRSIVAREGIDYLTSWAAYLDAQNGVDFNNLDLFRDRRRYLQSPRDIATYVHYDALYQAYLVACLLMANDGGEFSKDRGLPETRSRTRSAFASFGGPHILSLVTEVATRALKAVWRQKWLHHRRARPEVTAALLTLHENVPTAIIDPALKDALAALRAKLPNDILAAIAAHNTAQNVAPAIQPLASLPADFPAITDGMNYLLPMAFPEGSPTHPAYGAGHATVAGACVTTLKAFFEMYERDGSPRPWPFPIYVARSTPPNEGGELIPWGGAATLTMEGELDKLAANIAIARNFAGVHYYTDYYESLRLGERIAASIIEEHLSMYDEAVSMSFTSFDGDRIRIQANGDAASVLIYDKDGARRSAEDWYARYED